MNSGTDWEIREYSTFDGGSEFTIYRRSPSEKTWVPVINGTFPTLKEADGWLARQKFEPKRLSTFDPARRIKIWPDGSVGHWEPQE